MSDSISHNENSNTISFAVNYDEQPNSVSSVPLGVPFEEVIPDSVSFIPFEKVIPGWYIVDVAFVDKTSNFSGLMQTAKRWERTILFVAGTYPFLHLHSMFDYIQEVCNQEDIRERIRFVGRIDFE